jgi:hypothetical protein
MCVVSAALMVTLLTRSAAEAPSVREILDRVGAASASTPNLTADVVFKLWRRKPSGDQPPDCEFTGTMVVQAGRPAVRVSRGGTSLFCSALNHYVVGRMFDASEPLASFLDRFDFTIAGDKQIGADAYYQIQGPAHDPKGNPHAMSAWVDYTTGLVTQGTLEYDWGTVDVDQQYTQLNNASVLVGQNVRTSKYSAVLLIVYSNFRFSP